MKYHKPLCQLRVILKIFKSSLNDTSANVHYMHMFSYSNKTSYNICKVSNRRQKSKDWFMRTLCTGNGVWILVEKISCAGHDFFQGARFIFLLRKLIKKQSKTNKQTKTTWIQGGSCACNLFSDSLMIVFVPFWLILNAMISCICGIYSSNMYYCGKSKDWVISSGEGEGDL